jgi:hypothetical protein
MSFGGQEPHGNQTLFHRDPADHDKVAPDDSRPGFGPATGKFSKVAFRMPDKIIRKCRITQVRTTVFRKTPTAWRQISGETQLGFSTGQES